MAKRQEINIKFKIELHREEASKIDAGLQFFSEQFRYRTPLNCCYCPLIILFAIYRSRDIKKHSNFHNDLRCVFMNHLISIFYRSKI